MALAGLLAWTLRPGPCREGLAAEGGLEAAVRCSSVRDGEAALRTESYALPG